MPCRLATSAALQTGGFWRTSPGRHGRTLCSASASLLSTVTSSVADSLRWRSLVVVTNSFHQLRSYLVFRCAVRQSLPGDRQPQVWLAHVPVNELSLRGLSLQKVYSSWDFIRELAALLYYWLRGWLCQSACLQRHFPVEQEPHIV